MPFASEVKKYTCFLIVYLFLYVASVMLSKSFWSSKTWYICCSSLSVWSPPGYRKLRELVQELTESLSMIFQQSWYIRELPADWTLASTKRVRRRIQEATDPADHFKCHCEHTQDNQGSGPARMGLGKAHPVSPTWSPCMTEWLT